MRFERGSFPQRRGLSPAGRGVRHATPRVEALEGRALMTIAGVTGSYINAVGGQVLTDVPLIHFTDANGSKFITTIDWGDGANYFFFPSNDRYSLATVTSAPDPNDSSLTDFTIEGTHTYSPGLYTIKVNIIGGQGEYVWTETGANINLNLTGIPISGVAGTAFNLTPIASFGAFEYTLYPGNYYSTIDWGDGTLNNGAIEAHISADYQSQHYTVDGNHTYSAPGTYTILINVWGGAGSFSWIKTTATIAPTITPGAITGSVNAALAEVPVASFKAPKDAPAYTAAIDWGDGSAPIFAIVASTLTAADANGMVTYQVEGTHVYKSSGSHTVLVNILNPQGQSIWIADRATITPYVTGLAGQPITASAGKALTGVVVGSFAGWNSGFYAAAIDGGDGTAPTFGTLVAGTIPAGSFTTPYSIDGSHTFAKAGKYTVLIDVIDSNGESFWAATTATVS
jgi:hypothetical protein